MILKDRDEIKELFQKELGNYQAKVDPGLWNGIQAGLGSTAASTGVGSSFGLVGKTIIATAVAATITVGTILIVKSNQSPENKTTTELTTTEFTIKKSIETVQKSKENEETSPSVVNNKTKESEIEITELVKQEKSNVTTSEEPKEVINDLRNNNSSFKEETIDNNSEKEIVYNEVPKTAPTEELNLNQTIEDSKKVDLSKVNIQIVKQNNQYITFSANEIPEGAELIWNFGDGRYDRSLNPEHFYADAGVYDVVLTVQSETQEVTKNIQVDIQMQGEVGSLPNVFTPNGDGKNDEFFIECKHLKSFQLTVMDNHQNIVFSTNDSNFRWNGIDKNGAPVKEGNYIYIIVAEDEAGNIINKYQHLHIHR